MEADVPLSKDLKVLLIDDDSATREILSTLLQDLGITEIQEMTNGVDALAFIKHHPGWKGIVLCDWNMPRMSGASFYRQAKAIHHEIPFIMVTGRNDEDSIYFAKDQGIFAYLLKPVAIEELERKLRRVIDVHKTYLGLPQPMVEKSVEQDQDAYTL